MKIFEKQSEIICRLLYSENLLCPLPLHPRQGHEEKCERKMRLCHAKVLPLQQKSDSRPHWSLHQPQKEKRKGARVAEEARLESVYTSKAYRGFESPSFRYKSTDRQAMKPDGL